MGQWYYSLENQRFGPVVRERVEELLSQGVLSQEDLVWSSHLDSWKTIGEVLGAKTTEADPAPLPSLKGFSGSVQPAGFWRRAAAYSVDVVLLAVAGEILTPLLWVRDWNEGAFMLLVSWIYFAGLESSSSQATLGKLMLSLRVTDLEGRPLSFLRASGRFFGKFISALLGGVGFLMAAFTSKKQALHDLLAGSLVVRGEAAAPVPRHLAEGGS